MDIAQIVALVFIGLGFLFLVVGAIGVLRFPDFFTRIHAAGVGDTLGVLLVTIGMMIYNGFNLLSLKILVVFIVLLLTNPFGTNLIMLEGVHFKNYKDYLKRQPVSEEETEEEE